MKIKLIAHCLLRWPIAFSIFAAAVLVLVTGCETTNTHSSKPAGTPTQGTNDVILREADVVKVVFPGNDKLNSTETIRRDGKVTLPVIGEVTAAGKTPDQLRQELVERYSKELVSSKEISVVVVSSSFPVYVMGAVLRPGKVTANHPLTVLEAIMEAGGFDYDKAQLKSVKVVRTQNGKTHTYVVNLIGVKNGTQIDIFYLLPSDIVIVPQKLVLF